MPSPAPAAAERFEMLPWRQLRESTQNTRKHLNPHKLEELIASVRERGIITPLIVRPTATEIISGGDRAPVYEIAAGHRRYRAAMQVYKHTDARIPCRILDLTDEQFLEIVTIENLQREDIHPLEEADGYREMLRQLRYAGGPTTLADRIGKPVAYVRGRLELCDLVPVVRESFLRDAITIGHARLISRLPEEKQEEALRMCFEEDWQTKQPILVTVAELRREIRRRQGADLSIAPFALDARVGGVGPCTECPKCSGVQRSLIADNIADQTCFDRACFDAKVAAHIDSLVAQGFVQISNSGKAQEGVLSYDDYVEAEPPTEQIENLRSEIEQARKDGDDDDIAHLEKELAELEAEEWECPHLEKAVYVVGDRNCGKIIDICRNPECEIHGKDLQHGLEVKNNRSTATSNNEEWQRKREEEEAERKIQVKARKRAWEALLSSMGTSPKLDRWFLQIVASGFYHRFNEDFCKAFGIDWKKGDFARDKGKAWTETASDQQLVRAIIAAAFWEPGLQEYFNPEYGGKDIWELFVESLKRFGVDFKDIEKQVKAELAEKAAKKKD